MIRGCYVRVHVGPDNGVEVSIGQLFLMIEEIRLKPAHFFLQFGGELGIRQKRVAVLFCLLSASHKHSNAGLLTIMANVVASCADGVVAGRISGEPPDLSTDDSTAVRVSAIDCMMSL